MPLTCFVPLGLVIALLGLAVYFLSRMKRLALLMISAGLAIALFAVVAVLLAVNSGM